MKHFSSLLPIFIVGTFLFTPLHGTITVIGNDTTPITFNAPINTYTFDQASGTLYVGLGSGTDDAFSIARINSYTGINTPTATGIANSTSAPTLKATAQKFLTLAGPGPNALLAGVTTTNQNRVYTLSNTGSNALQSDPLYNAASTPSSSTIIRAMAANASYIYTALSSGTFGTVNDSGIAVVTIASTGLAQTDASTGSSTPKAKALNQASAEVQISGSANPTFNNNFATMYWDEQLQRLYTGLQLTSPSNAAANGLKSVVVARNNATNPDILDLSAITPDATVAAKTQIVAAKNNGASSAESVSALKLRTMHTSTGLSYLIVNGGNNSSTLVGNKIFALPLIDNPTDIENHGTLANKNILTNGKFQTVPTSASDIPADYTLTLDNADKFALVGGPALFPLVTPNVISDLVVVGDTVYASSNTTANAQNDAGIFYTQAIFDHDGKIAAWTPWQRAFQSYTPATDTTLDFVNTVTAFSVNPTTGKIFAILDDATDSSVISNQWNLTQLGTSLNQVLTAQLKNGTYASLDLNSSTNGLGMSNANRYALFGGARTVAFARTAQSTNSSAPFDYIMDLTTTFSVTAPQTIVTDFSLPENFLVTQLPSDAGCITSLAYSQRLVDDGTQGYFFAGTSQGLYVFSNNGTGFNITAFDELNAAPFTTGSWSKVPQLTGIAANDTKLFGNVVDIQTAGQQLYVITTQSTAQKPYLSTLWRIPYQNTVSGMFAPSNIIKIAESGTDTFEDTSLFTGMQIIKTGALGSEDTKEQLLLSTNTGLYKSDATQSGANTGIIEAADQTAANWTAIDTTTMYSGIAGMTTPVPMTAWPISIEDPTGKKIYSRSSIHQISGDGGIAGTSANIGTFDPEQFNNEITPTTTLPTDAFWSDGARRFLIANKTNSVSSQSQLLTLPFTKPVGTGFAPFDPQLLSSTSYTWINLIGSNGVLLAGSNKGVVALQ